MTGALRIGLVGCGRLTQVGYVPAFDHTDVVQVAAVADPDGGRRAEVAGAAGGVPTYPSLQDLLRAEDVDAVVLASPVATHLGDATRAASSAIPVLVEKPPAPDASGAARIAALGGQVWIGFNRRFDPGAAAVRAAIGPTDPVDLDVAIQYRRAGWRPHTVRDDVLLDLGPHLLDWVRWVGRCEITGVRATQLSRDAARLELTLDRGRATVEASAEGFHAERIVQRDPHGGVVTAHRAGGRVAAVVGRVLGRNRPHPLVASLAAQLDAFAAAIAGDPGELATPTDGLAVMAAVDAARASADRDGTIVPTTRRQEQPTC